MVLVCWKEENRKREHIFHVDYLFSFTEIELCSIIVRNTDLFRGCGKEDETGTLFYSDVRLKSK